MKRLLVAILAVLVVSTAASAASWWSMHHGVRGVPGGWSAWDESSADSLRKDQDTDGTEDTYVCFFDAPNVGDDEIGTGTDLSEADRTLTQAGAVAAALGDPAYRPMDGVDDEFTVEDGWLNKFFAGKTEYTLIIKCYIDSSDDQEIATFMDTNAQIRINSGKFTIDDADNVPEDQAYTLLTNQVVYVAVWTSATDGVTRGGVCASGSGKAGQPTKWSDFNAANRVEFTNLYDNLATYSSPAYHSIFNWDTASGYFTKGRLYYVVASSSCLIDNP